MTLGNTATIELVSALNAFGEEVKDKTLANLGATITSSDVTIASVTKDEETGKYTVKPRKEGPVTFKVEFPKESKIPSVELTVEVKAAQKATSIEAEDLKVPTASDLSYKEEYIVLDQYGVEFTTTTTSKATDAAGKTVTSFEKEGIYTVTVYDAEGTKLGSYKVQTVAIAEADVDKFEFSTDKNFLLDRNEAAYTDENHKNLKLTGYIDGVKLTSLEGKLDGYELVSSDKKVLTVLETPSADGSIEVTPVGVGTATVSLVKVEGDITTVVAKIELTVVNSTPQITKLTAVNGNIAVKTESLLEVTEANTVETIAELIAPQLTAGKDAKGNEIFKYDQVENIEYSSLDKKVIVTLNSIYGGGEFVFDVVVDAVAPEVTGTITVGDKAIEITSGETINEINLEELAPTDKITEDTIAAVLTEDVIVTIGESTVSVSKDTNFTTLLELAGLSGEVTVADLEKFAGKEIVLKDAAGNETVYKLVLPAQE